jgi:hypothetical protein
VHLTTATHPLTQRPSQDSADSTADQTVDIFLGVIVEDSGQLRLCAPLPLRAIFLDNRGGG